MRYALPVFAMLALLVGASAPAGENPLKNAKPGDWAVFSVVITFSAEDEGLEIRAKIVVMGKDGNKVTLATYDKEMPSEPPDDNVIRLSEVVIDIGGKYDVLRQILQIASDNEEGKDEDEVFDVAGTGKETVTVPAGAFECDWIEYSPQEPIKVFCSDKVPVWGLVKLEKRLPHLEGVVAVIELLSFGSDAPLDDKDALWGGDW